MALKEVTVTFTADIVIVTNMKQFIRDIEEDKT